MTAYDTEATAALDALASPAPPSRRLLHAAMPGWRVLHDVTAFALLLALALAPIALRLYLIVR